MRWIAGEGLIEASQRAITGLTLSRRRRRIKMNKSLDPTARSPAGSLSQAARQSGRTAPPTRTNAIGINPRHRPRAVRIIRSRKRNRNQRPRPCGASCASSSSTTPTAPA